jgi:integrase
MASLKYRIKGNSKDVSIYLRFSISRESVFEIKTGFSVDPSQWSSTTNFPKQNSSITKLLYNNLKKLESYVFQEYNICQANGDKIDKYWLNTSLLKCFEREEKVKYIYYATDHIQFIIDNADTKKIAGQSRLGLSHARIQSYKSFKRNFEEFELFCRKRIKLTDITPSLVEEYKKWLLKTKCFSINYAGKQLDNLRAVGRDAERLNIPTHPFASKIDSFCEQDEDRHIVTFSIGELQKIRKTEMPTLSLENAKKWLLLGCEIGQRGGDLLNLTQDHLRYVGEHLFIDVNQQKTKKDVTIPIGSKAIQLMLENDFPQKIATQNLNNYIKKVCQLSGIDEIIEGKLLDKKSNRKIMGTYPKYQLVTTHSFRRTFASNYYKKIATPILMTITGHSKESMFLKYINKQDDKDENAKLFLQYYQQMNQ